MSRQKRKIFEELIDEVRRSQAATDRYDQAVADAVGLNRTDMRCLDYLQREGPATAGALAEATGLTTGAMLVALDRLERAGYARRVRDGTDRRRVLVELTPELAAHASGFYSKHQAEAERLYQRYNVDQMELLLEFVRNGRQFNEQEAALLEQDNRLAKGKRGSRS